MQIIKNTKTIVNWRKKIFPGKKIALVPTMGALHAGHLSLVEKAKKSADLVVVSIFVNPTQFAKNEDLSRYPRPEKQDITLLKKAKVDMLFMPQAQDIYASDSTSLIDVASIGKIMEGEFRPTHFAGVATIVAKLFNLVQPDVALFGEKDFQQLQVIKKLVHDFNFPVKIIAGNTVREADGLALSSRNIYLSENERKFAPQLYKNLLLAKQKIIAGEKIEKTLTSAKNNIISAGFSKVDYLELIDETTLTPLSRKQKNCRILVAAHLGKTRLIDNLKVF